MFEYIFMYKCNVMCGVCTLCGVVWCGVTCGVMLIFTVFYNMGYVKYSVFMSLNSE